MSDLERYHRWNLSKERKFIERWQRVREKGALRFVLIWGGVMSTVMAICLLGGAAWMLNLNDPFVLSMAWMLPVVSLLWGFLFVGFWYGILEQQAQKTIAKHLDIERAKAANRGR